MEIFWKIQIFFDIEIVFFRDIDMASNSLENDEELEKQIDKFVNNRRHFQSRHYKNRRKPVSSQKEQSFQTSDMSLETLCRFVYHRSRKQIHNSFRKSYFTYLASLTREELLRILEQNNAKFPTKNQQASQ